VSPELNAALDAARAAHEVIQALYQRNLAVTLKADKSPVTEADVRAEEAIGEETGHDREQSESVWLVDPIDGTKSFVRDCPFFSTQIALMRAGQLVLGVSSALTYGELAWAQMGEGAYLNGERVRVSAIAQLESSILSVGNLKTLAASPTGWPRLGALIGRVNRLRGYGDFLHYHLLARGALDAVIESDVNILDIAALTVIVREAGGTFTQLDGTPVSLSTTTVLASNGLLHKPLLAAMQE
jgi:histidinol-phosphatase